MPDCCILTPEKTFCCPFNEGELADKQGAKIRYTVCNKSGKEKTYEWKVENLGPGSIIFAQEDAVGAITVVSNGSIGPVPPGGCASIDLIILCEMEPGQCANYVIRTLAGPGEPELVCRGEICMPEPGVVVLKGPDEDSGDLGAGEVRPFEYHLVNPTGKAVEIPVTIASSYGAIGISLSREEPGESALETIVKIPARSETILTVYLTRLDRDGVLPSDMIRLFANAGEREESRSDDHVSSITLARSVGVPFRVIDFGCVNFPQGEFVRLDLFLEKGPIEMIVEELNLETREWEQVPIRLAPDDASNKAAVILDAGHQVIYSPQMGQTRGIFRVVCTDEPKN